MHSFVCRNKLRDWATIRTSSTKSGDVRDKDCPHTLTKSSF